MLKLSVMSYRANLLVLAMAGQGVGHESARQ